MTSNISIVISGTLTGFTRLFSYDVDNKLRDFEFATDYRSPLFSLERGQEAYSISFAPQYIQFSKSCTILDAYRRPGLLVISVLLNKNTGVRRISTGEQNDVLKDLLDAIMQRFMQNHCKMSTIDSNQNLLMQNEYMDILADYDTFIVEQRDMGGQVLENKFAYVISSYQNIRSYLSTPCRRSYRPYSTIFFVESNVIPQSAEILNEPPEEVIIYSVRFVAEISGRGNSPRLLGEVSSLSEKINLFDNSSGYEILNASLSYKDIVSGADSRLSANCDKEVIVIKYTPVEKREHFSVVLSDRNNARIDINSLPICLFVDNRRYSGDDWSIDESGINVSGSIALKRLTLEPIDQAEYKFINNRLDPTSTTKIVVETVFRGQLMFNDAESRKTLTFVNQRYYDKVEPVHEDCKGQRYSYCLYGDQEDWVVSVDAADYIRFECPLALVGNTIELVHRERKPTIFLIEGISDYDKPKIIIDKRSKAIIDGKYEEVFKNQIVRYLIRCNGFNDYEGIIEQPEGKTVKVSLKPNLMGLLHRYKKILILLVTLVAISIIAMFSSKIFDKIFGERSSVYYLNVDISQNIDLTYFEPECRAFSNTYSLTKNGKKLSTEFSICKKPEEINDLQLLFIYEKADTLFSPKKHVDWIKVKGQKNAFEGSLDLDDGFVQELMAFVEINAAEKAIDELSDRYANKNTIDDENDKQKIIELDEKYNNKLKSSDSKRKLARLISKTEDIPNHTKTMSVCLITLLDPKTNFDEYYNDFVRKKNKILGMDVKDNSIEFQILEDLSSYRRKMLNKGRTVEEGNNLRNSYKHISKFDTSDLFRTMEEIESLLSSIRIKNPSRASGVIGNIEKSADSPSDFCEKLKEELNKYD